MARAEDAEQTLIFVDMLGFGALVKKYKVRVVEHGPDENGFSGSSTTPIQSQFYRFNLVLDLTVRDEALNGGLQAMLFSDCAYIRVEYPSRAVQVATAMMRRFIEFKVAVRMGMGLGTFYDFEYSTNTNQGSSLVSKSRFLGTSVLNAYAAEQCGGKGMRIFVDSSLRDGLTLPGQCDRIMPLRQPLKNVGWELNYLHDREPMSGEAGVDAKDVKLFENVAAMTDPNAVPDVLRHYTDTLEAMNRMRSQLSRKPIDIEKLVFTGPVDNWL